MSPRSHAVQSHSPPPACASLSAVCSSSQSPLAVFVLPSKTLNATTNMIQRNTRTVHTNYIQIINRSTEMRRMAPNDSRRIDGGRTATTEYLRNQGAPFGDGVNLN